MDPDSFIYLNSKKDKSIRIQEYKRKKGKRIKDERHSQQVKEEKSSRGKEEKRKRVTEYTTGKREYE